MKSENPTSQHKNGKAMTDANANSQQTANAHLGILLKKAMDCQQAGFVEEAQNLYKQILQVKPDDVNTLHLLGISYMQTDKYKQAVKILQQAIEIDDKNASIWKNLGLSLLECHKPKKAQAAMQKAIELRSDDAALHYNLGIMLERMGRRDEALVAYKQAIDIKKIPEAYNNVGQILFKKKQYEDARASFEYALSLRPDYAYALSNIGMVYKAQGNPEEALKNCMAAVYLDPDTPEHKIRLSNVIDGISLKSFNPDIKNIIELCLQDKRVKWEDFSIYWMRSLLLDPAFAEWIELVRFGKYEEFKEHFDKQDKSFMAETFLLEGLASVAIINPKLETLLTLTRHYCLEKVVKGQKSKLPDELKNFLFSLAEYCLYTEYVFFEMPDEKEHLEALRKKIEDNKFSASRSWVETAMYACYRPLYSLKNRDKILTSAKRSKNEELQKLVRRQIAEPAEEQKIFENIESLTDQAEESQKYHEIYDANPYPRWKSTNIMVPPEDLFEDYDESLFDDKEATMLIAGCGTGQHSLSAALNYPFSKILAIDFSKTTLAYAIRKAREFSVKNIEYKQADIMKLDKMDQQFNFVDCAGVIHHIDDYERAFQILADLVKPGGKMSIGVYSATARENVKHVQDFTTSLGLEIDDDGIRKARRQLMGHPDKKVNFITQGRDFYSMNSRYHIFPMAEHWFTIDEIKQIISDIGMEFKGFKLKRRDSRKLYKEMFPDDPNMLNLDNWHEFEQKHRRTFAGMYAFILQKPKDA